MILNNNIIRLIETSLSDWLKGREYVCSPKIAHALNIILTLKKTKSKTGLAGIRNRDLRVDAPRLTNCATGVLHYSFLIYIFELIHR